MQTRRPGGPSEIFGVSQQRISQILGARKSSAADRDLLAQFAEWQSQIWGGTKDGRAAGVANSGAVRWPDERRKQGV